jgi:hypothetical protein
MRGRSTWVPSSVTTCRSSIDQPGREKCSGVSRWVSRVRKLSCSALIAFVTPLGGTSPGFSAAFLSAAWAIPPNRAAEPRRTVSRRRMDDSGAKAGAPTL